MLTFNADNNRCIAVLEPSETPVYIKEVYDKGVEPEIDTSSKNKIKIFSEFLDLQKKLTDSQIAELKKAFDSGISPTDPKMRDVYKRGLAFVKESLKNYLSFGSEVSVYPKFGKDEAFSMYLSGASGAGKSHLISELIQRHLPSKDAGVFYIGPFADDPSFKKISKHIIPVDLEKFREQMKRDLEVEDFPHGSVIIWDDIESLPNAKEVEGLRDRILSVFRHYGLKMFCVNHVGMNGAKSKKLLLECKYLAVYPSANWKQVENLLKTYMGLDREKCMLIKNQPSRWVICCKAFPSYFISQHSIGLLN